MHRLPLVVATALWATLWGTAGCSHSDGRAVGGCSPAVNERLDPRSTIHLFPGATEPIYLTDPPTSGPHQPGPPYQGVVGVPIPRPSQVAMLEAGYVILQWQGLARGQVASLDRLAGNKVAVALPAGPLPAPVVATAWTWKLECGSIAPTAVASIRAFVAAHRGVGFPGGGGGPATTADGTAGAAAAAGGAGGPAGAGAAGRAASGAGRASAAAAPAAGPAAAANSGVLQFS